MVRHVGLLPAGRPPPRHDTRLAAFPDTPGVARAPFLIDCDTGIDDALALLYACASPEIDLVGVTCVAGNVEARQVARNTQAILELAGRADIEVALGREEPLIRPLEVAPETHGPRGLGYAELPEPIRPLSSRSAVDVILDAARVHAGGLTVVTLGPLTNLAMAVMRDPSLPGRVRWVLMGGSYRSGGNTAPTTEWNMHVDPEAAHIAFEAFRAAGRRPLALGLDVTERAKFTPDHLERLASSAPDSPVVRFAREALRFYMEFHSRYDGFYGAFIHDPLAVAAAIDPALVVSEALAMQIELNGRLTAGETVTDWRRAWGREPNVDVAVSADTERFMDRFIDRVGGLAATRAMAASGVV
jgi:purine nucleosidase